MINDLDKIYHGFLIKKPVGNNSFSFERRKVQEIYVPSLIEGRIVDLAVGQKIVFSEVFEEVEFNQKGLEHIYYCPMAGKEVFIFDNHNHAFFFWMFGYKKGWINAKLPLVHIDQHTDMREPQTYLDIPDLENIDLKQVFEYTNFVLNVGNFIKPAKHLKLFSDVQIINSPKTLENPAIKGALLDIDIDIFAKEMDYIDYDFKIKHIKKHIAQSSFITVATSPYFMDQGKAIEVIQELFI